MEFILRDYQLDCVESVMQDLKEQDRIGVIQSTGAGKTEQFIEISKRFIDENPGKVVLVLSHLSILTSQTANRYRKRIPGLSVGILQGQRQPKISDKIVIATVQSAHDETKIRKWLRGMQLKVGLVIADECHRLISTPTFEKARKQHHAKLIGFTATPFRENMLMTNMFDTISYTISMQELIDKKRLVPFELHQILLGGYVESDERIMKLLALYLDKEKGCPAVMYWRTIEEARTARNVFTSYGISCSVVTGDIRGKVRDEIMSRFNQGKINVLSTCDVLTAGADMPLLEVILMPYGTKSPTVFLQRVGRGSRPQDADSVKPEHKKQNCRVYMVGDEPTIKSGFYRKLEHRVLHEGSEKYEVDLFDELEFMELAEQTTTESYKWTKEACEIIREMNKIGLPNLASKLNHKKFPPRYLKNLALIKNSLTKIKKDDIIHLDKALREATEGWVLPTGKFMGWHVRDLPYWYRKSVLEKFPNSNVGKIIYEWYVLKRR